MIKSSLKSLTFAAFKPPTASTTVDPTMARRATITKRLEEQKRVLADPAFTRTVRKLEKDANGGKRTVEKEQKVLPWFTEMPNGNVALFVKLGWHPVEIEKGKPAIVARSFKELPSIIDTLITAVAAGELDAPLSNASKAVASKLKRKSKHHQVAA